MIGFPSIAECVANRTMAITVGFNLKRKGARPMAVTLRFDSKRKGASPPVSAGNLRFLTGQLTLFCLK